MCSCSNISIYYKKKPNNFYYTNELMGCFKLEKKYSIFLLDTSFYKKETLDKAESDVVKGFLSTITNKNFISKPKNLPEKPQYKLYFTFNNKKYVSEIYNEKFISIYPWDGEYERDYINMENVPNAYNLYGFCKNIIPR